MRRHSEDVQQHVEDRVVLIVEQQHDDYHPQPMMHALHEYYLLRALHDDPLLVIDHQLHHYHVIIIHCVIISRDSHK
jgi:hypothetical protein